jgi:hypothetical protein
MLAERLHLVDGGMSPENGRNWTVKVLFVDSPCAAVVHNKGCMLFKSGSFLASQ